MKRVLFILKKGCSYGFDRKFSGLFNSTKFVSDALGKHSEIISNVVEVVDNNCIDREVAKFKPDIVVLEALWVVPEKFDVLRRLHPRVLWGIHLHSDIAFLGMEGVALSWLKCYAEKGIVLISNSRETIKALKWSFPIVPEMVYLPNCYPAQFGKRKKSDGFLNIGCFGAVRPLKNQLIQAMAAIRYAEKHRKTLRFHINGTRVEQHGENVLKNLRALFTGKHTLIEHGWKDHKDFIETLREMDLCMQVSFSETFNIVSADAISSGVPVLGSKEVEWLSSASMVDPNSIEPIVDGIEKVINSQLLLWINQYNLKAYASRSESLWQKWVLK